MLLFGGVDSHAPAQPCLLPEIRRCNIYLNVIFSFIFYLEIYKISDVFFKIKYTQGIYDLARNYYLYALKLNPNNVRALYGVLLVTSNLKTSQKSKDFGEHAKLAAWSRKKIADLYAKNKSDEATMDQFNQMMKYLQV